MKWGYNTNMCQRRVKREKSAAPKNRTWELANQTFTEKDTNRGIVHVGSFDGRVCDGYEVKKGE